MWHELFAPTCPEDTGWSHQKLRELREWRPFSVAQKAPARKPTARKKLGGAMGSGFPSAMSQADSQDALGGASDLTMPPPLGLPVMIMHGPTGCGKLAALKAVYALGDRDVFYGVENTPDALEEFLNTHLYLAANTAANATSHGHGVSSAAPSVVGSPVAPLPPSAELRVGGLPPLVVVKELPIAFESGRPGRQVVQLLERFIRAVEICKQTRRPVPQFVFVHTVHDTHSVKIDLRRSFPATMVEASATKLFNCTAVTDRALKTRLTRIVKVAANPSIAGASESVVDSVVATAHGDIRQALLQLQWALLVPPPAPARAAGGGLSVFDALAVLNDDASSTATPATAKESRRSKRGADSKRPSRGPAKKPPRSEPDVIDLLNSDSDGPANNAAATAAADDDIESISDGDVCEVAAVVAPTPSASAVPADGAADDSDLVLTMARNAAYNVGDPDAAPDTTSGAPQPATNVVRNAYIDVAHGAARVLCQKYAAHDVLQSLSVDAFRLVSYVSNNAWRYAASASTLAQTTQMLSFFDICHSVARDPATRLPATSQWLPPDETWIRIFSAVYQRLPDVVNPNQFIGLKPSPNIVPALLHLCERAPPPSADELDGDDVGSFGGRRRGFMDGRPPPPPRAAAPATTATRTDRGAWRSDTDTAAARLRAELNSVADVFCASDDVAMDWLPMLPYILLDTQRPANSDAPSFHGSAQAPPRTLFHGGAASAGSRPPVTRFVPPGQHAKPPRTLFRPGMVTPPPPTAPPRQREVSSRVAKIVFARAEHMRGIVAPPTLRRDVRMAADIPMGAGMRFGQPTGDDEDPIEDC